MSRPRRHGSCADGADDTAPRYGTMGELRRAIDRSLKECGKAKVNLQMDKRQWGHQARRSHESR